MNINSSYKYWSLDRYKLRVRLVIRGGIDII